ncbi:MAG TPA: response regulator [Candidatus Hydrogenedentes bacterium]|nr:response regulator [Candidatus Hydrogenedentota bacterium]
MTDKIRCLYVDDQVSDPALWARVQDLKEAEFELDTADKLETAEKSLRTGGYDILILDIRIPPNKGGGIDDMPWQRTGTALIKRIRKGLYTGKGQLGTPKDVPIIVITAVANPAAQKDILEAGRGKEGLEFELVLFEKPADNGEVIQKIKELAAEKKKTASS